MVGLLHPAKYSPIFGSVASIIHYERIIVQLTGIILPKSGARIDEIEAGVIPRFLVRGIRRGLMVLRLLRRAAATAARIITVKYGLRRGVQLLVRRGRNPFVSLLFPLFFTFSIEGGEICESDNRSSYTSRLS